MTDRQPPRLFDRPAADAHRRRALARPKDGADFLLKAVGDDLVERLATVQRNFSLAADLGSPTAYLAKQLLATGHVDRVVRLDRVAEARPQVLGDAERLPFAPASLDLVVSALSFQFADDLPGALAQIRRALQPDGLLLAAFLGGETLSELRQALATAEAEISGGAAPRVAPFVEVRVAGALLQRAGFALPVADLDRRTVRYDSMFDLMADLRAMGAANALVERSRRPLGRAVFARAAKIYAERFSDPDGRIRATFDIVSLSGWSPHESQQRPLKPGSAKTRLADALGVRERSAGEKAGD